MKQLAQAYKKLQDEKQEADQRCTELAQRAPAAPARRGLPPELAARARAALQASRGELGQLRSAVQGHLQQQLHQLTEEALRAQLPSLQGLIEGRVKEWRDKWAAECDKRRKLHNLVQELRGNIRVYCRVRPLNERENGSCISFPAEGEIQITNKSAGVRKTFAFNQVFKENSTQDQVFADIRDLVVSVIDGYNVCIFAYGQTGSGKTFSMQGYGTNRGIYPITGPGRAVEGSWALPATFEPSSAPASHELIGQTCGKSVGGPIFPGAAYPARGGKTVSALRPARDPRLRSPWCGVRVGEALVPGPQLEAPPATATILVANVIRWSASWRGLLAAEAQAWCIQEARIPAAEAEAAAAGARGRGMQLQLGPVHEGTHLLAAATRVGRCSARASAPQGLSGRHPGRLQHVALHFGQGRALHVMNCYGYAGGRQDIDRNADLILEGVGWLRSLGDAPALLVGDLNCRLADTGLDGLLAMAGWPDLLRAAGPTCIPSQGEPSRIDYALANESAAGMVTQVGLRWDFGLAMHAALLVTVRVGRPELALLRQPVAKLDGPARAAWSAASARDVTTAVRCCFEEPFRRALRRDDLDAAWEQLGQALRTWLATRLGAPAVPDRPHAAAALLAERPPTAGGDGEAADAAADAALLRLRRLRSLQHARRRSSAAAGRAATGTLQALWASAAGDAGWEAALAAMLPSGPVADSLIEQAETEWRLAQAAARAWRRSEWRRWVDDSLRNDQGRLYRWIRGGGCVEAELVPAVGGVEAATAGARGCPPGGRHWLLALQGGPAARLRYFEGPWRALWQRAPAPEVDEEWQQELDGLPPFPDRTPWTADLLAGLFRHVPRRKKPGLDAWTIGELRLLPTEMLELVAELFEEVEAQGAWPRELVEPEGLLLPKPGGGEGPLERRPIWLLPILYRIWAAGRARAFAQWRCSWEGDEWRRGAEELAWELAFELEAAEALSQDIVGAALDWRKAYDQDFEHRAPADYKTFNELFRVAAERRGWKIELKCALVEIYNEEIRDLLADTSKRRSGEKLQVRQGKEGNFLPGLTQQTVASAEEVEELLATGSSNRQMAATDMNAHSSRSHLLVQIFASVTNVDGKKLPASCITLVDLAGSERLAKSGVEGDRAKEAIAINKSLSALGDVINARATKGAHTPFRNSPLTHMLQDSLSGDSKTLMLLQINPCVDYVEESMCSLQFGARAGLGGAGVNNVEMKTGKSDGDLPSSIELGGAHGGMKRDITAVLMGRGVKSADLRSMRPVAPWDKPGQRPPDGMPRPGGESSLPPWLKIGAHLSYRSKSSGKLMEVVVELVNQRTHEVEITFVEDRARASVSAVRRGSQCGRGGRISDQCRDAYSHDGIGRFASCGRGGDAASRVQG
ncbi:unnamed protein product [Prorocentrum cordatum]|nr:unnamed protein product [Polarella glacialis]